MIKKLCFFHSCPTKLLGMSQKSPHLGQVPEAEPKTGIRCLGFYETWTAWERIGMRQGPVSIWSRVVRVDGEGSRKNGEGHLSWVNWRVAWMVTWGEEGRNVVPLGQPTTGHPRVRGSVGTRSTCPGISRCDDSKHRPREACGSELLAGSTATGVIALPVKGSGRDNPTA